MYCSSDILSKSAFDADFFRIPIEKWNKDDHLNIQILGDSLAKSLIDLSHRTSDSTHTCSRLKKKSFLV